MGGGSGDYIGCEMMMMIALLPPNRLGLELGFFKSPPLSSPPPLFLCFPSFPITLISVDVLVRLRLLALLEAEVLFREFRKNPGNAMRFIYFIA